MPLARRSRRTDSNIWPAFVDAQGQLLMAIIFVLLVLSVFQFVTTDALSGRDSTIVRLTRQISELNEMLGLERRTGTDLRSNAAQLAAELQAASAKNDALTTQLAELQAKAQDEAARADRLSQQLVDANQSVDVGKEKITVQLKELESLRRDIDALRQVRADLEAKVSQLAASQQQTQQDLTAARDRSKELEAKLSTAEERTALAQKDIQARDIRLEELLAKGKQTDEALANEKQLSTQAQQQVDMLNKQIAALRDQLQRISSALELAEGKNKEQAVQLGDLTKRLNVALASKVEELSRYRSEFFGRLREIIGDRQDVRVVGDRFVFQSEVLFDPGNASLGSDAQQKLNPVVTALKAIIPEIPQDLNWVLRVDGHTDLRPISTPQFPSNWELSTARAISVVKYLIQQGIPPDRVAATGFGEFQPIDKGIDEAALRRNRRIELKLTER